MTAVVPTSEAVGTDLTGKVAVVTGSARGIGFEIARAYADAGAIVVLSDLDDEATAKAAASLPNTSSIACDVRAEGDVTKLIDFALSTHGSCDVVVANAGVVSLSSLVEMPFTQWRDLMAVNLDGVFLTVTEAARSMLTTGTKGSIITTASVTALGGVPMIGHYAASKAAVVSLTKTLALELRAAGVRVNALLPGFAETDLVLSERGNYENALGLDFNALMNQTQGGYVDVPAIARLALFLADDRSAFCTGGAYVIDGGLSASLL